MTVDKRPFAGIRMLEVGRAVASPFAGYLLGLLSADVIKIEEPGAGDTTRNRTRGSKPELGRRDMHMTFMSANANKRSLTLNLRLPEEQQIFRQLAYEDLPQSTSGSNHHKVLIRYYEAAI